MNSTRLTVGLVLAACVAVGAQPPQTMVQNGRVEARTGAAIDREVAAVATSADPVWVGWRVPIVAGERGGCSSWWDDDQYTYGTQLDYTILGSSPIGTRPQLAPPTGPAPLEGGTGLVVLARVSDGRVERLRTIADNCPIDAGGRTVYWLTAVTPAESLRWLDGVITMESSERLSLSARRSMASTALSAAARHRDAGADVILDRIAGDERETNLRPSAFSQLARYRGAHGFATIRALLASTRPSDTRHQLLDALGETREPGTVDAIRPFLKDTDSMMRASAVYSLAAAGGPAVIADVNAVINTDTDNDVRTRAVSALNRLPADVAIPALIALAKTHANLAVRKQATQILGRSHDPRAEAFILDLVSK